MEKPLKIVKSKEPELMDFGAFCVDCKAKSPQECARCLKHALKVEDQHQEVKP